MTERLSLTRTQQTGGQLSERTERIRKGPLCGFAILERGAGAKIWQPAGSNLQLVPRFEASDRQLRSESLAAAFPSAVEHEHRRLPVSASGNAADDRTRSRP